MRRIRSHLTYANVMATIAVFLVLGGGSAVALSGSNTVQSDDLGPGAQVKAPDVAAGAVGSAAVINESLTGQDVKNQSGVDTCTHGTVRYGELCVGIANEHHNWYDAHALCAALELRLPSMGEAFALARNHELPNVDATEDFWTEEFFATANGSFAMVTNDGGGYQGAKGTTSQQETVCVTTPTN
jgi:hypothetical protein